MDSYSKIVALYLKRSYAFQEVLTIVKANCLPGKIWLIGGQVFRPILQQLYDIPFEKDYDFDFIVGNPIPFEKITTPDDWTLTKTGLGSPRLINGKNQIDIISLDNSTNRYVKLDLSKMSSKEKMESYFSQVPLNIQALAYDINRKEVIGKEGIKGITNKILKVNCIEECLTFCKRRKISVRKFLDTKIKPGIFKYKYPSFSNDVKLSTIQSYDDNAQKYISRDNFKDFIHKYLSNELDLFLTSLEGKKILDIGAGNGRDSMIFQNRGFKPIAIDISKTMVNLCKKNGIEAYVKDIENCDFEDNSFDGVFAYCSLLHIPKKRIYNSIARISELLKTDGIFFIGMIKGKGEKFYEDRFFTYYSQEELETILSEYFQILKSKSFKVGSQVYLNYICKKVSK
jgi:ubiquinone/menaquinone biosynthesis C-methylase UbiE